MRDPLAVWQSIGRSAPRWLALALLLSAVTAVACAGGTSVSQDGGPEAGYPVVRRVDLGEARDFSPEAGEQGTVRYELSAPALVRIRIVDSRTPGIVLRTLLDWAPREGGVQSETWDGRDRHGEPLNLRGVSVVIQAEPQREGLSAEARAALEALAHPEHKHFAHSPERCGDLEVRVETPQDGVLVAGWVDVRAVVAGRAGMPDPEYHVVVYLDGRPAWDGRVGEPRIDERFDTRNVPDGEYVLAVTFNDLHDHAGSDWVAIVIDNSG